MNEQSNNEDYPNPQLKTVNFEIRYYPILNIDSMIGQFQEEIIDTLPDYRSEKKYVSDRIGIQERTVHSFFNEDKKLSLNISNSNFHLADRNYKRYSPFKDNITTFTRKFFNKFESIKQILFIGLRYVNNFEFKLEETDFDEFLEYFNINDASVKDTAENFRIEFVYKEDIFKFKKFLGYTKTISSHFFTVDIDSNSNARFVPTDLDSKLESLHDRIIEEFELIITDKLRDDVLRGVPNGE